MKNRKYQILITVILTFLLQTSIPAFSQGVTKSQIKENIDGKEYYLHFVKSGETLYNIAKAYNITVDDIFKSNASSREGIKPGNILKIPVEQPDDEIAPELTKPKDTYFYHIVKKQETLYGLSRQYNVSIDAIQKLNPESATELKEGETLKIPYKKEAEALSEIGTSDNSAKHIIADGETLYAIARNYNVTTGEIINANPGIDPLDLDIGQIIIIPNQNQQSEEQLESAEKTEAEKFQIHVVEKGETLYSIAREYAVSIDTLKQYNVGLNLNLYIGQNLKIPKKPMEEDYLIYEPDRKEKLEDIADKYRINYQEVYEVNPNLNRKVKKGQQVKIPVEKPEELPIIAPETEVEPSTTPIDYPCPQHPSARLRTYNIALMLPLFLQEIDSLDKYKERGLESKIDLISFRFLNFYAGFKLAVDSMEKAGMKMNLFVYDVDNDPAKVNQVLQKSELSSMDLIIGPLYAKSFSRVAHFANTFQIPIVNPLSTREEIIGNNPYVYKLKPDEEVQTDLMVNYLLEHYPKSNIVLVRHNKYKYQSTISYIRNKLNSRRHGHVMIPNSNIVALFDEIEEDQIFTENKMLEKEMINRGLTDSTWLSNLVKEVTYIDDSVTGLEMNLSLIRNNIVVAISSDIVFTKDLMSQLNKLRLNHEITLFGLPDWNSFRELETNQLLNLHVHTFTPSIIDYNDPDVVRWIESYRSRFHTEPTTANYAFDGFDAGWYFLNALYKYGSGFGECIRDYQPILIQTKFQFESKANSGYQNTFWNMGKYQDYTYKRVRLPQIDRPN